MSERGWDGRTERRATPAVNVQVVIPPEVFQAVAQQAVANEQILGLRGDVQELTKELRGSDGHRGVRVVLAEHGTQLRLLGAGIVVLTPFVAGLLAWAITRGLP